MMDKYEAEKIVRTFGGLVASKKKGDFVRDVSELSHSPARIKYAYFLYTEALILEGIFTDEIKGNLETTFGLIDAWFIEDGLRFNEAARVYMASKGKNQEAKRYIDSHGGITAPYDTVRAMTEYHNFVADCYGNWPEPQSS